MALTSRLERISLAIIGFVGIMDTSFLLGIISPYAVKLGASDTEAGIIAGIYSMVAIPASLAAGVIVDKVGRKRSLITGLAWDSTMVFTYSLAKTPVHLALIRALHAVGGSLVYPAYISLLGDKSEGSRRKGMLLGGYLSAIALAVAIGSMSSAAVVSYLGYHAAFRLLTLILLVGFTLSFLVSEGGSGVEGSRGIGILKGLASAKGPVLAGLALIFLLYVSFGVIVGGLGQALLRDGIVSLEEEASGVVGASIGLAVFVSVPLLISFGYMVDRGYTGALIATTAIIAGASLTSLMRVEEPLKVIALFAPYGLVVALFMLLSTLLVLKAPREARGSAVALQQVFNILGVAIGAPIAGALSEYYGIDGVSIGILTPILAASPIAIIASRRFIG